MADACVLVLAGLDPSGGAGILADAEAVRAAGARPLCLATALTVQTSRRARSFEPVRAALVEEQAAALLDDEPVRALKLGMLGTPQMAAAALRIAERAGVPLVVDPVLRASSGAPLFLGDARAAYARLFALATLVTPNLDEARELDPLALGARAVLIKGGHLEGDAVDVLHEGERTLDLRAPRIAGDRRGKGCRLASAIAARLALGDALETAVRRGKEQVRNYLATKA